MFLHWRCASSILYRFHNFFSHFWQVLNLDIFFHPQCLGGCLACAICNFNSIHSFIFKLCILIVHTLKMCTSYFVKLFYCFSHFWSVLNLDMFFHLSISPQHFMRCQVCVICNSKSFPSFLFKLFLMIVHIWKTCTLFIVPVS